MLIIERFTSGVVLLEPEIYQDERGHFFESFNQRELERLGISAAFVQDNRSHSIKNVLRGLHYQINKPQGKLVSVSCGEVFDVAVDLRKKSPTFGTWTGLTIVGSGEDWVEFVAAYERGGRPGELREHSLFEQRGGRWVYVEGSVS